MKRILLLLCLLFTGILMAAPFSDFSYSVTQPDGQKLNLLATGDEYFNYLHDAQGYTVILDPVTGYYCYAQKNADGTLSSSGLVYGTIKPQAAGIKPNLVISREQYLHRRTTLFTNPTASNRTNTRCPSNGQVNNLVVFIRFADQQEFTLPRSEYESKFNGSHPSLQDYYHEVSYNQLNITSYMFPPSDLTSNVSYQDSHTRNYFVAYNQVSNPQGYSGDNERTEREHQLLADACAYIESELPTDLNLDMDNDGLVDNVCFIIDGNNEGWAELLWAHRWVLYSQEVTLHGKQVYDYTFQPETQNDVVTLCHEMFHSIGAPDLYHYNDSPYSPCGPWDLMESGSGHPTAFMKWKYGHWISDIPTAEAGATITLNSLLEPSGNCVKIPSSNPDEYYTAEYRLTQEGTYEANLPDSGILIYRINTLADDGNAQGPPDELYIYRPGGSSTQNGSLREAVFSLQSGRTSIGEDTDPNGFLSNGSYGGLYLANFSLAGDATMSFIRNPMEGMVVGTITVDLPDYDYSAVRLTLDGNEFTVNGDGTFLINTYIGTRHLHVTAPGCTEYDGDVQILANGVAEVNIPLTLLPIPHDLHYTTSGPAVSLYWSFDDLLNESFTRFEVQISFGGNPFYTVRATTDTTITFSFTSYQDLALRVVAAYGSLTSYPSTATTIDYNPAQNNLPATSTLCAWPNPFNPRTTISWDQPQAGMARLDVYDVRGRLVRTLCNNRVESGHHELSWDGTDNAGRSRASGVYFIRLQTPGERKLLKTLMLK